MGMQIHVSPCGSPLGDGSNGYPVKGIERALSIVRRTRQRGERATIWLHEGTHRIADPIELTARDSFTTIAAWPPAAGRVHVESGVHLRGWRADSISGHPVWAVEAPRGVRQSLFVDGRRVPKPRFPRDGFLRMADVPGLDVHADLVGTLFDGSDRFIARGEDIPELAEYSQTEVVVPHFWVQERFPIDAVDADTGEVRLGLRSMLALRDGDAEEFASFYFDGVPAELGAVPGEWFFDEVGALCTSNSPDGSGVPTIYYSPLPGQDPGEVDAVVPMCDGFAIIEGTESDPIVDIRIEGIAFGYAEFARRPAAHAPFQMREDPWLDPATSYACEPQAAAQVPGAITVRYARYVAVVDCAVRYVGGYALRWEDGVQDSLISGCTFADLGAGALAAGGSDDPESPGFVTRDEFSDNVVHGGGRVYPHCAGVLIRHASHMNVVHNEISDLYSTAISVGWRWDESSSPSTFNRIEANYLHDLGQGVLDWFGAVYTLGVSPGTLIARNHIARVQARTFGGWGILLDPASAAIEVVGNVVHDTSHEAVHIKSGRNNLISHNVFARAGEGFISLAIPQNHLTATVLGNIFVTADVPVFVGAPGAAPVDEIVGDIVSEANGVVITGDSVNKFFSGNRVAATSTTPAEIIDQSESWFAAGNDLLSVSARSSASGDADLEHILDCADLGALLVPDISSVIHSAGPRDQERRPQLGVVSSPRHPQQEGSSQS